MRSSKIAFTFIVALFLWVIVPPWVYASVALVPKDRSTPIGTSSITFADVFQIPREIQQLSARKIVDSYRPGQTQPIYQYQVERALQTAGLGKSITIKGTFPLVVKIGKKFIPDRKIETAINGFLNQHKTDNIQWEFLGNPKIFTYPDEAYSLKIQSNQQLKSGRVALRCVVKTAGKKSTYSIPVKLSLKKKVVIAVKNIARGEHLSTDDFTVETRAVDSRESTYALMNITSVNGSVARTRIQRGEIVTSPMLKKAEVISSGQDVKLELQMGNIVVNSVARALEPGGVNDKIQVRDQHTGKILHGTITEAGIVQVNPVSIQ